MCYGALFTAPASIELYAEAFEDMGCLDKLEAFASTNGPRFHDIPSPAGIEEITLVREPWTMPETLRFWESGLAEWPQKQIIPFRAGEE